MKKITDIRNVRNTEDLLGYFAGRLGWNIDLNQIEDIDDISYDFTAEDLGLTDDAFARIRTLRQLRPFDGNQKWAMFCIEFDSRKFEVSAIRKILSALVPRRRKDPNQPVWNMRDILFLCDWGGEGERTVGLAHFEQREKSLPQVKVISCAPASPFADPQELRVFEENLSGLAWPKNAADTRDWAEAWSSAFKTVYRQTITQAAELTQKLAAEALAIRRRILSAMAVESANGYVHLLCKKFRETLIADMSETDFADMYAQTIVYGLFSARCMDRTPEDFSVTEAIACIPSTNPFLRKLMEESLGVRSARTSLSFDELEIGNVVDLLLHTNITQVVNDFNRQTNQGREDPVIHFYEDFLTAYDKAKKVQCGVFYTPKPVVDFIVRAVDDILRRDFGLADGLASTATREIRPDPAKRKTETVPAVQILDPATGTGTFLRQAILRIYETFRARYAGESEDKIRAAWNEYVPRHLLPRLNAFELMMAPYAVAHMKLAMVLKDTGYDFAGNERLRVYLTNSLEEPGDSDPQGKLFDDDPLATESIAANGAKKNRGINIVIGNPPYSGESENKGEWIMKLMEDYKKEPGGKEKLKEKNPKWINDDYVKFIRLAQHYVERTGRGVLAYINAHGFIDNPTFRGMRWQLMQAFDEIYVLNLHGNSKKKEKCPDGSTDDNVFDIMQGVSINLFVRRDRKLSPADATHMSSCPSCVIYYADLYGPRDAKYDALEKLSLSDINWQIVSPSEPMFFFVPKDFSSQKEYEKGFLLTELMPLNGTGVVTKRDSLCIQGSPHAALEAAQSIISLDKGVFYRKYNLPDDVRDWRYEWAKEDVLDHGTDKRHVKTVSYRPFDVRYSYYTGRSRGFMGWPVDRLFRHFSVGNNVGLVTKRGFPFPNQASTIFVTKNISDFRYWSCSGMQGGDYVFPLYLYQEFHGKLQKVPNLNSEIVKKIETVIGKTTPEDIFNYIYAVLHSPTYREKYKEFLKIDFPRIPYPTSAETFHKLAALGEQLVAIHTMKDFDEADDVTFEDGGDLVVGKVAWKDGNVFVNKKSFFTGVERETFDQYIGGYQPLQKWLKDRKGRPLSDADISHYKRIVRALRRTAELMSEIDKVFAPCIQRDSDVGDIYPTSDEADYLNLMAAESGVPL